MITEWFIWLGEQIASFFIGLIPQFDPNGLAQVTVSTRDLISPFLAGANSMGVWLPWVPLSIMFPLVFGLYSVSLFAKFARTLLSHVPQFGGNG